MFGCLELPADGGGCCYPRSLPDQVNPLAIGDALEGDRAHHCDMEKSVPSPSPQLELRS